MNMGYFSLAQTALLGAVVCVCFFVLCRVDFFLDHKMFVHTEITFFFRVSKNIPFETKP